MDRLTRPPPWRYLATGGPVDVGARPRVEGAVPGGRWGRLLASFVSRLIICYVRLTHRVVLRGALPATGCVAVSFHRSYWDGLLVCMLDPRITAVTSRSWRSVRGVGRYLESYGVLWTGEHVVARAERYVRDGGVCWLAPCGFAPSTDCPQPHTGAAQIARATGAPIVCLTLRRGIPSRRPLRRGTLTFLIGEPLPGKAGDTVDAVTARLVAALRAQERARGGDGDPTVAGRRDEAWHCTGVARQGRRGGE